MYANTPFDCDGAQIRACSRQLATVVTVTGELDDVSAHRREFQVFGILPNSRLLHRYRCDAHCSTPLPE